MSIATKHESFFVALTKDAEDSIWDTRYAGRFVSFAECTENTVTGKLLIDLIGRPGSHAQGYAGSWLTAYWLYDGRFEDRVLSGLNANQSHPWPRDARINAMNRLAAAAGDDISQSRRFQALHLGLADPDTDVFDAAADVFRDDSLWQRTHLGLADLVRRYLERLCVEGLNEGRQHHLRRVAEKHDRPRVLAETWLHLIDSLVKHYQKEVVNSAERQYWIYEYAGRVLAPLLLRLLSESENDADVAKRCLDAWDLLLSSGMLNRNELRKVLDEVRDTGTG